MKLFQTISKNKAPLKRVALMSSGILALGLLHGCTSQDDKKMTEITVSITNLTANQPMSPTAVISHNDDFVAWEIGKSASEQIENLAESGDASSLITLAEASDNVSSASTGDGLIGPGRSQTITFEIPAKDLDQLTLATMLVNTNDAFTGAMSADISNLKAGKSMMLTGIAYDAGTEANTETAESIPGPAGGGEGYNASREGDTNRVSAHPGVISTADGLLDSALDPSHRFDNPVAKIVISREK